MIFLSLVMILPRVFDCENRNEVPRQKLKNMRQGFVATNMMNRCAKFHKDNPLIKFNLPSAIELSETADFVYNFV